MSARRRVDRSLAGLVRSWFLTHLKVERSVSDNTIESYAATFRLLVRYCMLQRTWRTRRGCDLHVEDLDAPVILQFLQRQGTEKRWTARTRNARLAAVKSFFKYLVARDPASMPIAQRVLAIPSKRYDEKLVGYLTPQEMNAVLDAAQRPSWSGRRDHAMFLTAYATGARVSEFTGLLRAEASLDTKHGTVKIHGKGRKDRIAVLSPEDTSILRRWVEELGSGAQYLFPNRFGRKMTRSGAAARLGKAVSLAVATCPTLRGRRVSPHVIRHSTAMNLLEAGVPLPAIALFLGHGSIETTHRYVVASAEMKRQALEHLPRLLSRRRPAEARTDELVAFLEDLQRTPPKPPNVE